MSYLIVNVIFNDLEEGAYRKTIIFEQNSEEDGIVISPKENIVSMWGEEKKLVTIKEIGGNYKIIKFVENIYANNFKVFDFDDYDIRSYTINGERNYMLEERKAIKIPSIL